MAGKKGRPAGSKDVAPMIRGAFKRAALALEQKGRPLSLIIQEQLEEKPLDTLRAISTFCPKELEVTQRAQSVEDMSNDELEQLASLATAVLSQQGEGDEGSSDDGSPQFH